MILGHEPLLVVGGFEHVAARQKFYKCLILSNFGFSSVLRIDPPNRYEVIAVTVYGGPERPPVKLMDLD